MIRTILAAGLILAAGGAYARDIPTHESGTASAARSLGNTASPAFAYGPTDRAHPRDVESTGTIVIRHEPQRVMGLPVPGEE